MKVWTAAPCALAMLACSACGVVVVNGVGGGGGGGASTGTEATTTTGTGMVATPTAVAFRYGDLPAGVSIGDPTSESGSYDPNSLVLIFTNQPQSCSAPMPSISTGFPPSPCDGGDMWVLAMVIPPDLARQGLIDLRNERIGEQASEVFAGCNGDGQRLTPGGTGVLDITGNGPSALSVQLTGGVAAMMTVVDGSYSATWCSAAPSDTPSTPAIAFLGANLPAGASISPTVGASPDPTATYVFAGTAPQTCTAPVATSGCDSTAQITFRIPAGTAPGTYDLGDPTLAAWYVDGCPGAGQSFPSGSGTITINSVPPSSSQLLFTIYGSFQSDGGYDFDDDYAATLCGP